MKHYEYHPAANIFPLLAGTDFETFCTDIKERGLLEPIWLYDNQILDGRNRYRACQETGVEPDFLIYEGDDPVAFVVSLNLHRRHLTESQRGSVAAKISNLTPSDAARLSHAATANLQSHTRVSAAKLLNVSERTVNTAKKVQRDGIPELDHAVSSGSVSVSAAADVATLPKEQQTEIVARGAKEILNAAKEIRAERSNVRRIERMEKLTEIQEPEPELNIERRYPVIYADPPWRYDYAETENRAIENQYPTMALNEICELPVNKIATDDSILFMWTTSPKLADSFEVIKAWGFKYVTCAVWDKEIIGMGYYFRQQHELLLVATRGAIPAPAPANRPSSVFTERRSKHSKKPAIARQYIEAMYPNLPKIELFARHTTENWNVWGNQA